MAVSVAKDAIEIIINALGFGIGKSEKQIKKVLLYAQLVKKIGNSTRLLSKSTISLTDIRKLFGDAINNAKLTGALLACALALRFPFKC